MIGCSAPYREALENRMADRAWSASDDVRVVLVNCDGEPRWAELERQVEDPAVVAIAILPHLDIDAYMRAFALGAGAAIYADTTSAITVDAVEAAIHGEVLLPLQAVQHMAKLANRVKPPTDLDASEVALLQAIAAGRTIVDLANEYFYSERTVRRHLQNLYLKLGVRNRAEAIAAATRMGITD